MDTTNSIQSNYSLRADFGALKETQPVETVRSVEEQANGSQSPLRGTEQEPKISQDGIRLAAVANDNVEIKRTPAISNTEEAQKAINQLFKDIQSNPTQAVQSQKASAASVNALVGGL